MSSQQLDLYVFPVPRCYRCGSTALKRTGSHKLDEKGRMQHLRCENCGYGFRLLLRSDWRDIRLL